MHVHLRDPKLLPPSISNKQKTTLDFNKLTSWASSPRIIKLPLLQKKKRSIQPQTAYRDETEAFTRPKFKAF